MAHSAYVHIPFCAHKCDFCDFTAFAGQDHLMEPYCRVVCREIVDRLQNRESKPPLTSIFYGGGTPGLIEPAQLKLIHDTLVANAGLAHDAEVTLETTPSSITVDKAKQWQELGITRLSIGVESLHDNELKAMGRGQGRQQAIEGIEAAMTSGFGNISCDLMYGLPEQTLASWTETLKQILSYKLPHLSAYGLTIAINSPLLSRFPRDSSDYPDEHGFVDMYQALVKLTGDAGLNQYEISNFCLSGYESVHNLAYWRNEEYFGFGVGAYRYVDGVRSNNWRSMKRYMQDWLTLETSEVIDADARMREAIFLSLRTRRGLSPEEFQRKYQLDVEKRYADSITKLIDGGFLERHEQHLRLTQSGILVSNLVMSEFM